MFDILKTPFPFIFKRCNNVNYDIEYNLAGHFLYGKIFRLFFQFLTMVVAHYRCSTACLRKKIYNMSQTRYYLRFCNKL